MHACCVRDCAYMCMSGCHGAAVLSDGSSVSLELLEEALHWHRYGICRACCLPNHMPCLAAVFDHCA
jgi:REP element-mobilizing transposase RayT